RAQHRAGAACDLFAGYNKAGRRDYISGDSMTTGTDKEFRFGRFKVAVPPTLWKKWQAISVDEQCEIIKSVAAAYRGYNAQWRTAASAPIREGARALLERKNLALLTYEGHPAADIEKASEAVKQRVLWLLQFECCRNWKVSPIAGLFQQAVGTAAIDGD